MGIEIWRSDDPEAVVHRAGEFLRSEPALHNLILTLLHGRIAHPEPGRYWIVEEAGAPIGVVFQSPLDFAATVTPMTSAAVDAVVASIVDEGVDLPGVNGDAGTTARFAGQWTELHGTAARPDIGMRLYELGELSPPVGVSGRPRLATPEDATTVAEMVEGFHTDTGETGTISPEVWADLRIALQQVWLWADDDPCAMVAFTAPVAGVSRIQAVYTPPEHRRRGYAGSVVAHVSRVLLDEGVRVILYTDLGNPTSNSVYRRIGFRAVGENLRYDFEG
jgi:uncharacterized protein